LQGEKATVNPRGQSIETWALDESPSEYEVIQGLVESPIEGEYPAEYLVEPEHIRQGVPEV
jgi:hypothetical protein